MVSLGAMVPVFSDFRSFASEIHSPKTLTGHHGVGCRAPPLIIGNSRLIAPLRTAERRRHRSYRSCRLMATGDIGSGEDLPPALLPLPGMTPVTERDVACIEERHLLLKQSEPGWDLRERVVGAGCRCKHGWPQALVYDPIWDSGKLGDTTRLTCPLLVEAIGEYERAGAIKSFNARVQEDETWREELLRANMGQRDLRKQLVEGRDEEMAEARELMGSKVVDIIMETGIAQMRLDATDVKCLHAQVADELTRGGNAIGRQVLRDLEARGVEVCGSATCCDHCDVTIPLEEARWSFQGGKNKLGQRLRKLRRKQDTLDVRAE